MGSVPFLYVNVLALFGFALMFSVFMAARKTPEIRAFLFLVIDCLAWTGGSILMRLQTWPGVAFWYYVSLLAIFSTEFLFYLFLHSFTRERGNLLLWVFFVSTVALVPGTVSGFFLAPPTRIYGPGGAVMFTYTVNWHMVFPCILFVSVILASLWLLLRMAREEGGQPSGAWILFWGGLVMLAGNMLQILLPGNTFPYDTLAGVVFASMVAFALYRRRLFRMTLAISHGLLTITTVAVYALLGIFFVRPGQNFLEDVVGLDPDISALLVSVLLAGALLATYTGMRKLINVLFIREGKQHDRLKQFSSDVTQSLSTDAIMDKLADVIREEVPVDQIYICLPEGNQFKARYSANPLNPPTFSIDRASPKIRYLQEQESYLIISEYHCTPHAISDWAAEKELFQRLDIACMVAMRNGDEVTGLILLSSKLHGRPFGATELGFLETVSSIASMALKNAGLYEQMYREARIDPLTGMYNYRYFIEQLEGQFAACGPDGLTLMYIDADDFKLYNQLYGVGEGDIALCRISQVIRLCVGDSGGVYRTSGKVFAVLLPRQDSSRAQKLAGEIGARVVDINHVRERRHLKPLSVSIGICSAPYAASSAKELMDNTDLATYNAKQSGKDRVVVFRGATEMSAQRLTERTTAIVEHLERSNGTERGAMGAIYALTAAIDAKDHYTFDHSKNVARYAACLALAVGLNEEQVYTIYSAGLLHDIGKISIPEDVLNKKGALTEQEYNLMKGHVNNSIEMIRHLPEMDYLIPAVLGHHERWDGNGYPRGIAGEEIPVSARCLAVADAFDAMVSNRPYRRGLSLEDALERLEKCAGSQLDPHLTAVFAQIVRSGEIFLPSQVRRHSHLPEETA